MEKELAHDRLSNFLTVMAEAEMRGERKISIPAHAQSEIMHYKSVRGDAK